jgi:hypothetical protein
MVVSLSPSPIQCVSFVGSFYVYFAFAGVLFMGSRWDIVRMRLTYFSAVFGEDGWKYVETSGVTAFVGLWGTFLPFDQSDNEGDSDESQ